MSEEHRIRIDAERIELWRSKGVIQARIILDRLDESGGISASGVEGVFDVMLMLFHGFTVRENDLREKLQALEGARRRICVISIPMEVVERSAAAKKIEEEMEKAQKDKSYIPVLPFPIQIHEIGPATDCKEQS